MTLPAQQTTTSDLFSRRLAETDPAVLDAIKG